MSLVPRCGRCDARIDAYGRDGVYCADCRRETGFQLPGETIPLTNGSAWRKCGGCGGKGVNSHGGDCLDCDGIGGREIAGVAA